MAGPEGIDQGRSPTGTLGSQGGPGAHRAGSHDDDVGSHHGDPPGARVRTDTVAASIAPGVNGSGTG